MKLFYTLLLCGFTLFTATAQTEEVYIDFGGSNTAFPWNNISNPSSGSVDNLVNNYGFATTIDVAVVDAFTGANSSGTQSPNASLNLPSSASGDSFFGNTSDFNGQLEPTAGITLSDLDVNTEYTLTLFASRTATDNRETEYVLTGATTETQYLNPSGNTDNVVVFTLYPDANGEMNLALTAGPNNDNSYGFYYLGSMQISYASDTTYPEELEVLSPNGGEYWQVGRQVEISLRNSLPEDVVLSYTINGGTDWTVIDTVGPFTGAYAWQVPNAASSMCLIRASSSSLTDESDNYFQIADTDDTCRIVVIGSSTAAGSGASTQDSAWVYRYKHALYRRDTRYEVVNLAVGGYNTYKLIPTGTPIPTGVNQTIDVNRNITAALALNPTAVIVNLPSNDAANGYGVDQQMYNFNLMYQDAFAQGVEIFICTTQPRNFSDPAKIQIQLDTRDSILTVYGNHALDFWTGTADANHFILPQYNSGDGVHLNDAGHKVLFDVVMDAGVDNVCAIDYVGTIEVEETDYVVYPNPFNNLFYIDNPQGEISKITLYDAMGGVVLNVEDIELHDQFVVDMSSVNASGVLYLKIESTKESGSKVQTIPLVRLY